MSISLSQQGHTCNSIVLGRAQNFNAIMGLPKLMVPLWGASATGILYEGLYLGAPILGNYQFPKQTWAQLLHYLVHPSDVFRVLCAHACSTLCVCFLDFLKLLILKGPQHASTSYELRKALKGSSGGGGRAQGLSMEYVSACKFDRIPLDKLIGMRAGRLLTAGTILQSSAALGRDALYLLESRCRDHAHSSLEVSLHLIHYVVELHPVGHHLCHQAAQK